MEFQGDLEKTDEDGNTLFLIAAREGKIEDLMRLHHDFYCNTFVANKNGQTALALAFQNGHDDAVIWLLSNGIDAGLDDVLDNCEDSESEIVSLLKKHKDAFEHGLTLDLAADYSEYLRKERIFKFTTRRFDIINASPAQMNAINLELSKMKKEFRTRYPGDHTLDQLNVSSLSNDVIKEKEENLVADRNKLRESISNYYMTLNCEDIKKCEKVTEVLGYLDSFESKDKGSMYIVENFGMLSQDDHLKNVILDCCLNNQRESYVKIKLNVDEIAVQNEYNLLKKMSEYFVEVMGQVEGDNIRLAGSDRTFNQHRQEKYYGFVMEKGKNKNLKDLLPYLMESERMACAWRVVDIVEHLHDNGYAWMDVKCGNFINVTRKNTELLKLVGIDLDHAVKRDSNLKNWMEPMCWRYAPPELAKEGYCSDTEPTQYDIWSLGITVCEIMNKGICFIRDDNDADIKLFLSKLTNDDIRSYINSVFMGTENHTLRDFLIKCLDVNPQTRPRDVSLLNKILRGVYLVTYSQLQKQYLIKFDQELTKNARMLETLLNNQYQVPTLMLVAKKDDSGFKSFFADTLYVFFICPYSFKPGNVYEKTVPREWLIQAAPIINLTLILVDCAITTVTGIAFPNPPSIPFLQQKGKKHYEECAKFLTDEVMNKSQYKEPQAVIKALDGLSKELATSSKELRRKIIEERVRSIPNFASHYKHVFDILTKLEENDNKQEKGIDWFPLRTGLQRVTNKKGRTAWVYDKEEIIQAFRNSDDDNESSLV